jgi:hypothetical protein
MAVKKRATKPAAPMNTDTTRFIKALTEMNDVESLDHAKANAAIEKFYSRNEIRDVTKNTHVLIRKWVPQELAVVDKEQLPKAFELINEIYHKLYGSNQGTLDGIFSTDVRRPMIDTYGRGSEMHKMAKSKAKVTYEEKGKIIENAKKQVVLKNSERIEFNSTQILDLIRECNSSPNAYKRAIGLLLASGARPIELFDKSEFSAYTPADPEDLGNNPNWIQQGKLAKKRELEVGSVKPLIFLTVDQFLASLEYVRNELEADHDLLVTRSGQLKNAIAVQANRVMKELFQGSTRVTLYSCRGFYGTLSYYLCGRFGTFLGKNPSLQIWLNKVLGHKEHDLNTANNYSNFDLVDAHKEIDDANQQITLLKAEVSEIKERLDEDLVDKKPPPTFKDRLRDSYLTRIKAIYKKNPTVSQTQLEALGQAAVPKIPRAPVREFFRQQKLAALTS